MEPPALQVRERTWAYLLLVSPIERQLRKASGKMRVAKVRVGILRVEVQASTRLVR